MTAASSPAPRRRGADAALGVLMGGFAAAIFAESWSLPAAPFDPLGPGSFPLILAGLLGGLSVLLLLRVALGLAVGRSETAMVQGLDDSAGHRRRPWLAVGILVATLALAAAMAAGVGFLVPSVVFLAAAGIALSGRTRRDVAIALVVAAVGGTATWALFTRVFLVQWP